MPTEMDILENQKSDEHFFLDMIQLLANELLEKLSVAISTRLSSHGLCIIQDSTEAAVNITPRRLIFHKNSLFLNEITGIRMVFDNNFRYSV